MNLKPINLINTFPKLTPMEENRSNLEVSITMMMITGRKYLLVVVVMVTSKKVKKLTKFLV